MFFDWFGIPAGGGAPSPALEVLHRGPAMRGRHPPLVFVHGAYTAAWCWDEHFLPYFAARGYHARALSLRGHGGSEGRDRLHFHGLRDFVDDLASVVSALDQPAVLVGHSMGGAVVQKYLERHDAAGAVLMASVPPTGLGSAILRLMTADPALFAQISLMHGAGPDAMDLQTARRAVFSDSLDDSLVAFYARRMQGESQRALMDMAFSDLPLPPRMHKPPMLVIGAEDDALFSPAAVEATARTYGVEPCMIPGMAHAMMLEPGWERAAETLADWLEHLPG